MKRNITLQTARMIFHLVVFGVLTLLTQIGGIAYLIAAIALRTTSLRGGQNFLVGSGVFVAIYAALHIGASFLAPLTGRVPLPCWTQKTASLSMHSPLFCILNRNYVVPELAEIIDQMANNLDKAHPNTKTQVLDAGFPFLNGFPLLPHLSHDDGRKIDIAFYYQTDDGQYLPNKTRSSIGYWAFEQPEPNSPQPCKNVNSWPTARWDLPWLQPFAHSYRIDQTRTAAALTWLTTIGAKSGISKIFIEPHLAEQLGVRSDIIRFQGCRAARHDDHFHVELKR